MKNGRSGWSSRTSLCSEYSSLITVVTPFSPVSPHTPDSVEVLPCPAWSSEATTNPASSSAVIMCR